MPTAQQELERLTGKFGDVTRETSRLTPSTPTANSELSRLAEKFSQTPSPFGPVTAPLAEERFEPEPAAALATGVAEPELPQQTISERPGTLTQRVGDWIAEKGRSNAELAEKANQIVTDFTKSVPKEDIRSLSIRGASGVATGLAGFFGGQIPEAVGKVLGAEPGTRLEAGSEVTEEFIRGARDLAGSALIVGDSMIRKFANATPDPFDEEAYNYFVDKVGGPLTEVILGHPLTKEEYDQIIEQAIERPEEPVFGFLIGTGLLKTGAKITGKVARRFGPPVKEALTKKRGLEKPEVTERALTTEQAMRSELAERAETAKDVDAKFFSEKEIAGMTRAELEYYTGRTDLAPREVIEGAKEIRRDRRGRDRAGAKVREEGRVREGEKVKRPGEPVGRGDKVDEGARRKAPAEVKAKGAQEAQAEKASREAGAVAKELGVRYGGLSERPQRGRDGKILRDAEGKAVTKPEYVFTDPQTKSDFSVIPSKEVPTFSEIESAFNTARENWITETSKGLGIEYIGIAEGKVKAPDGKVVIKEGFMFSDPVTESSVTVFDLSKLESQIKTQREPFAAAEAAKKKAEAEKPAAKEPWEMTLSEFRDAVNSNRIREDIGPTLSEMGPDAWKAHHRIHIDKALSEGKSVPAEVLREYPDLVKPKEKVPLAEVPEGGVKTIRVEIEADTPTDLPVRKLKEIMLAELDKLPVDEPEGMTLGEYVTKFGGGRAKGMAMTPTLKGEHTIELVGKAQKTVFTLKDQAKLRDIRERFETISLKIPKAAGERAGLRRPTGIRLDEVQTELSRAGVGVVYKRTFETRAGEKVTITEGRPIKEIGLAEAKKTGQVIFEPREMKEGARETEAYHAQLEPIAEDAYIPDPKPPTKAGMEITREGELGKKPIGTHEIMERAKKLFNVPIRKGRRMHPMHAGVYRPGWDVIDLRDMKALDVMTHEVAHKIDWKNDLRKTLFAEARTEKGRRRIVGKQPKHVAELKLLDYDQKKKRAYEGFAEYLRLRLTERENPVARAPEFHKVFNEWLEENPKVKANLDELQGLITTWREGGAANRIYGQIDVKGKGLYVPFREKLARLGRKIVLRGMDDIYMLEYVEKYLRGVSSLNPRKITPETSPTMVARAVAKSSWRKAYEMGTEGTFDFAGNPTGISLRAALEPVAGTLKDWLIYAYAKRGLELHRRGIDPGIFMGDAKYMVEFIENSDKGARYKGALEEVVRWNDRVLQYAVDAGALSLDGAQKMRSLNAWYIPLKRVMDADKSWGSGSTGARIADLPNVSKRIWGSARAIQHPLDAMLENAAKIISISDKTRIANTLWDLVSSAAHGRKAEAVGKWMMPVEQPKQLIRLTTERIITEMEKKGFVFEKVPELVTEAGDPTTVNFLVNQHMILGRDNIISIQRGGKRRFFRLDPELYEALKGVDNYFLPKALDFVLGRPARMVRLGATGLNPAFAMIKNPLRDFMAYVLQTEYVKESRVVQEWVKSIVHALPFGSESARNMRRMFARTGADMSVLLGGDRRSIRAMRDAVLASSAKRKAMNIVEHPIELAREILSFSEIVPRMAEFEAAYKKGEKLYGEGSASAGIMAANAGSEVTVNFRRMGTYGRVLNQMIPFWNASVQGPLRFGRFAREHPKKAAVKAFMNITLPTAMLWWWHKDEDWYKNLPDWEKYNFWHFHVGEEKDGTPRILRVPRPFEWGIIFGSLPEANLNYWYKKEPEAMTAALSELLEQTTPDFFPVIPKLLFEYWSNYDYFRDRPIDPHWEVEYTKDAPEARFSKWTTETAKFIGKQFGMSPRRLEHIAYSGTGGLALDLVRGVEAGVGLLRKDEDLFDIEAARDVPVVGKLFARVRAEKEVERGLKFESRKTKGEIKRLIKLARTTNDDHFLDKAREIKKSWNERHPKEKIFYYIPKGVR